MQTSLRRYVRVPLRTSSKYSAIKSIPGQNNIDLHHLRRVVKHGYQPRWLRTRNNEVSHSGTDNSTPRTHSSNLPRAEDVVQKGFELSKDETALEHSHGHKTETVHVLLVPTSLTSHKDIYLLLWRHLPHAFPPASPALISSAHTTSADSDLILTAAVPRHPPISTAHAHKQSESLWPTTHNPNTVYGPNPADLASAQRKIQQNVGAYMRLAHQAAREARAGARGEAIGVVVVECSNRNVKATQSTSEDLASSTDKTTEYSNETVVCVAGDARYCRAGRHDQYTIDRGSECEDDSTAQGIRSRVQSHCNGNPANHAIMRAISFVAQKRRSLTRGTAERLDEPPDKLTPPEPRPTPLEQQYLSPNMIQPNGYLCLNLRFYTTHEPCVMCSMALVHSRVGSVVFSQRMKKTGGLCADGGSETEREGDGKGKFSDWDDTTEGTGDTQNSSLGYGLFWRPELNWRFLCWEWNQLTATDHEDDSARRDRNAETLKYDLGNVDADMHA